MKRGYIMKQLLIELFGYATVSAMYRKHHWTWTYREALEWAACYPTDDTVVIFHRWYVVGMRGRL